MTKVSVVIPTFNCGPYLGEAIKSVLGQSCEDMEIIIVDGGSSDSTETVALGYEGKARLKFIKKSGYGISAARNYGVKIAEGDFIAFLDGDDVFMSDKISRQIRYLTDHTDCEICYTNMIYFNSATQKEVETTYYLFSGDIFYYIKRNNFIHPSAVMARRSVFDKVLFDERLITHEDWEFFFRLAAGGVRFALIPEALSKIRVRERSISTDTKGMDNTRREVGLLARKYWKEFKKDMGFASPNGRRAISRYIRLKTKAALKGFPARKCFNRPVPQELVC